MLSGAGRDTERLMGETLVRGVEAEREGDAGMAVATPGALARELSDVVEEVEAEEPDAVEAKEEEVSNAPTLYKLRTLERLLAARFSAERLKPIPLTPARLPAAASLAILASTCSKT